jgi:hypothetical protein
MLRDAVLTCTTPSRSPSSSTARAILSVASKNGRMSCV